MKILQIVFAILLTLFVSVSHAAIIKLKVDNGMLLGADNVKVNGLLYNVKFQDGTCIALFSGCDDPSDFMFNTLDGSIDSSNALLDQVLIDSIYGDFDSTAGLTMGCSLLFPRCIILNPFMIDYNDNDIIHSGCAFNNSSSLAGGDSDGAGCNALITRSIANSFNTPFITFAVWSEVALIPAPGTAFMFLMGIAGLLVSHRRKQA